MTIKLDAKFMAVVMTQEGFIKWAQGKPIQITDVKPEWRDALATNFVDMCKGLWVHNTHASHVITVDPMPMRDR